MTTRDPRSSYKARVSHARGAWGRLAYDAVGRDPRAVSRTLLAATPGEAHPTETRGEGPFRMSAMEAARWPGWTELLASAAAHWDSVEGEMAERTASSLRRALDDASAASAETVALLRCATMPFPALPSAALAARHACAPGRDGGDGVRDVSVGSEE